jgi:hypothetical protein
MPNWGLVLKRAEKVLVDNSPLIMTAIGVAGTVTTAYLTGKASIKADRLLAEEAPDLAPKEKLKIVWKLYIPAVASAGITITAIILANRISTRRAVALASAMTISRDALREYQEKVEEKFGAKKEQEVRNEITKDRMVRDPASKSDVVIITGQVLCYDKFLGRYFSSDMETIRRAVNDINEQIIHSHYASLGDFQDKLGIQRSEISDELGWNLDKMFEIRYDHDISDDSRPCLTIEYEVSPAREYFRRS